MRPSTPQVYQCKRTQSTGVATQMELEGLARNCVATRTFREKKQQQSRVFLRLSFNVYTDIDNRERARARDKKQRRRILLEKQHGSFISAVRK